ncbi:heavy-metal-associated domain-containing protein [Desulfitibacter alkalitolerans]|uniref:heavy-metal-associated domain-containing protein n=1 Tax=Desulfitibacter alkalitolerans TaxID=264641 RepID=UPI0004842C72|nr:heavy metal-associated domain-containing protein [Desulfitibacter alkalitolerans]
MSMYKKVKEFQNSTTAAIRLVTAETITLYGSQVIKRQLMKQEGIKDVEIFPNKKSIYVKYYPTIIDSSSIIHAILGLGYKLDLGIKKGKPEPEVKGKGG